MGTELLEQPKMCNAFNLFLPLAFPSLWTDSGIVPTYLPEAPMAPIRAYWPSSGLSPSQNETVYTGDILERPQLRWDSEWGSLYTIMVVDFGVDMGGANFVHWMKTNVRSSVFPQFQGTENVEYLAPWAFERNADNTAIVDSGDAALHPNGILVFKQEGPITVDINISGCSVDAIFGRVQDISSLLSSTPWVVLWEVCWCGPSSLMQLMNSTATLASAQEPPSPSPLLALLTNLSARLRLS